MRRGEATREHIVERAACLFNMRGFSGASVSDVMAATGLKKGGIYRHFETKEALAVEAFEYAVGRMRARFAEALAGRSSPLERLRAILWVYADLPENPPVPGGCPIMNVAIENDDGNPQLRARARVAMDGLRRLVRTTLEEAVEQGELRPGLDANATATVIVATLEGGVMLAGLYGDASFIHDAVEHLEGHLQLQVP